MSYIIQKSKRFPVTLGTLTIYLSGYQLSGSSTLKETGAADGALVLAGCWGQGMRLKLKGRISPDYSAEQIISALAENLLVKQNIALGTLTFQNAMLCGYTLAEQQDIPELSLLFYCPSNPVLPQEETAS